MDTGLHTLIAIARFHQVPAEPEQLAHQFCSPGRSFSDTEILQASKALTLKAKLISLETSKLSNEILPAIAKTRDGNYFILAKKDDIREEQSEPEGFLIHDLREAAPRSINVDELENLWSGELIAVTRRQGLGESLQQIRYFLVYSFPGQIPKTFW